MTTATPEDDAHPAIYPAAAAAGPRPPALGRIATGTPERLAGYAALIDELGIDYVPQRTTRLSPEMHGARRRAPEIDPDTRCETVVLPGRTPVDPSPVGQLFFALRHDGVDLEALRLILPRIDRGELERGIRAQPNPDHSRRLWFLYEWMTGTTLDIPPVSRRAYIPLLDPDRYVTCFQERSQRHGLDVNLLGTARLCPMIRRTAAFDAEAGERPLTQIDRMASEMDARLVERVSGYLMGRESQGSFQIEGIDPDMNDDAVLFALIRRVTKEPRPNITRELLHEAQNAIITGDQQERSGNYRKDQVWIGTRRSYTPVPEYIAPQAADVPGFMDDFCHMATRLNREARSGSVDPVAAAAAISAAFVYIHPFMDGNGRLSRLLMQPAITAQPTPDGKRLFLPLSSAIHRHQRDYYAALDVWSSQVMRHVTYDVVDQTVRVRGESADHYRFPELTAYTEFVYRSANRAVREDIPEERRVLTTFDAVATALQAKGVTGERAELCFKMLKQNAWTLAKRKREHFPELDDVALEQIRTTALNALG